mmetsp:Transcript_6073/g.17863  ORF Transcript_6073/g.17863 Transcript_6073/m.17863 type:complete len:244 (-) Transcript_6073:4229-4960(-)
MLICAPGTSCASLTSATLRASKVAQSLFDESDGNFSMYKESAFVIGSTSTRFTYSLSGSKLAIDDSTGWKPENIGTRKSAMPSTPFVNSAFFTQTLICNISASSTLLVDVVPPVRTSGVKSLLRLLLLVGLFFIVTMRVVTSIVNNPFDVSSVKSTVSYQRTVYEATATPEPEASPETSKLSNDSAPLCAICTVLNVSKFVASTVNEGAPTSFEKDKKSDPELLASLVSFAYVDKASNATTVS